MTGVKDIDDDAAIDAVVISMTPETERFPMVLANVIGS